VKESLLSVIECTWV